MVWNKGKKNIYSKETLQKMSMAKKGKPLSDAHKNKLKKARVGRKPNLGKTFSDKWKNSLRKSLKGKNVGSKNGSWKGGVTSETIRLRTSSDYDIWRKAVYERDNYSCRGCGVNNDRLEAHHILPFAEFKHLRFDIFNGITLCENCHCIVDKFRNNRGIKHGNRSNK